MNEEQTMKTVKASHLREVFPMNHDTKFRLYVKEKVTGEILCDELFDTRDDVDKRHSELFCWQYNSAIERVDRIDGKPPKYDSSKYYITVYWPLSYYVGVVDWNALRRKESSSMTEAAKQSRMWTLGSLLMTFTNESTGINCTKSKD